MKALFSALSMFVGLVLGVVGAFVQAQRWLDGTTPIPWGAVLTLIVLLIAIRGAVWLSLTRVGGWALFAGWLLATVMMAAESPSGDMALSGGGRQMAYLIGGVVLGAAAATIKLPADGANRTPGEPLLATE